MKIETERYDTLKLTYIFKVFLPYFPQKIVVNAYLQLKTLLFMRILKHILCYIDEANM